MKLLLKLFLLHSVSNFASVQGFSPSASTAVSPIPRVLLESSVSPFDGKEEEHVDLAAPSSSSTGYKEVESADNSTNANSRKAAVHMLRQQTTVLKTSMVVAVLTAALKQLPHKSLVYNLQTGTIIFMIGDWAAQILTHWKLNSPWSKFELDKKRFILSTVLGCIWGGYINPLIYATVEHLIPGKSVRLVLTKMLVTCSILSTWGNYTTMMFRKFFKQLWEGISKKEEKTQTLITNSWTDSIRSCNQDFKEVLSDDLKIWPLYDLVCYSLIPPPVRPITNALMASAWAMYMSIASAKATPSPKEN